jgi:hypothetical protein
MRWPCYTAIIAAAEGDESLRRRRIPACHQQAERDVTHAGAVLVQRHDAVGLAEQADVGHSRAARGSGSSQGQANGRIQKLAMIF